MSFRNLDLNLLRVFDAVMSERNLTRAAEHLAMTQPAVSQALRRLKEATGHALFTRSAQGVVPTQHAEAIWPNVREALLQLRQTLDPEVFEPALTERSFSLAMVDATAAGVMPALVAEAARSAPAVQLCVRTLGTRDPRPLLEAGELDAAIGFFPAAIRALVAEGASAPLRSSLLYRSEYVCAMRPDHPLAADAALTLDSFCAARHLLVSFSGRPHGFVDEALAALGRERRVVATVNQFATAGRVAANTDVLTVLPRHFIASSLSHERLVTRELPFDMPPLDVSMLWHRRFERDPAHRWLRQALQAGAGAFAARG